MLARFVGLPLAFITFFVGARLLSDHIGAGIPLLVGGVLGWFVWWQFKKLDDQRLRDLLNPPAMKWHVPMPVGFGIVKDAFDGTFVLRSKSGLAPWSIQKEDQSRGIISALLNIQDLTGSGEPRTIGLEAKLIPDGYGTEVKLQYQIFSPTDSSLVEEIIRHTDRRLRQEASKHVVPTGPQISVPG